MFVRNLNPYTAIVFFMFAVVACVLIKQPIALGILTVCGIGYAVQSDRRYALRALWSIPVAAFVVFAGAVAADGVACVRKNAQNNYYAAVHALKARQE